MEKKRIALLFGGPSAEHSVSLMSARSVYENVDVAEIEWLPQAITRDGYWLDITTSRELLESESTEISSEYGEVYESPWQSIRENFPGDVDLAFPLLHGPFGEDGTVQGFLKTAGVTYIGCDITSSVLGMDKIYMKDILHRYDLPQARYSPLSKEQYRRKDCAEIEVKVGTELGYPCFVKPASMGSSLGISRVNSREELASSLEAAFEFDDRIVIEEAIEGREIECSVLGNSHNCQVSRPGEIIPEGEFYDYESKYFSEKTRLLAPANLEEELAERIRRLARRTFLLLGGEGMARVDFFVTDEENILINEINTIPGFTDKSMYPRMWQASGLSYPELVKELVREAVKSEVKDRE